MLVNHDKLLSQQLMDVSRANVQSQTLIIIKKRITQQLHMNKSIDLIVCFLIPHNIDILEDVYHIIYIHPV